jgi:hypothetical protein
LKFSASQNGSGSRLVFWLWRDICDEWNVLGSSYHGRSRDL